MRHPFAIVVLFISLWSSTAHSATDTFGITMLYPSKEGTLLWTSAHWNNGIERTVHYSDDPHDASGWTEDHSSGTDGFRIDGTGTMTMSGSGPRFHINSLDSSRGKKQFFRDVEFTAYYMRKGTAGKNWGGMVAGLRSGPLGHASPGGNDCDATTYYARFRNDGKWDFEKELKHPGSSYWSGSGYNTQDPLWNGAPLPQSRWIGMKFIACTFDNNTKVTLELYIDSTSNGLPQDGGTWRHVGTVVDSGTWPSGDVTGCSFTAESIILQGNGTALLRTDGDTAVYKMVSLREIDRVTTGIAHLQPPASPMRNEGTLARSLFLGNGTLPPRMQRAASTGSSLFNLRGQIVTGNNVKNVPHSHNTTITNGVYIPLAE